MTIFIVAIWFGGIGPAYTAYRNAGFGRISALFSAWAWPYDLGRWMARELFNRIDPE
jgi:hypothetical protein